jgi:hypothetical protein
MSAPNPTDAMLTALRADGVFVLSHQVCCSFATHVHEIMRKQIGAIEASKISMPLLVSEVHALTQNMHKRETRLWLWIHKEVAAWLRYCPALGGMYQFTFTEMIRQYALAFPVVARMGIRVPDMLEFVCYLLEKVYSDPRTCTGRFCTLSNLETFGIITQRLSAALCETMKAAYFPSYSHASSSLWNVGAQASKTPEQD